MHIVLRSLFIVIFGISLPTHLQAGPIAIDLKLHKSAIVSGATIHYRLCEKHWGHPYWYWLWEQSKLCQRQRMGERNDGKGRCQLFKMVGQYARHR